MNQSPIHTKLTLENETEINTLLIYEGVSSQVAIDQNPLPLFWGPLLSPAGRNMEKPDPTFPEW